MNSGAKRRKNVWSFRCVFQIYIVSKLPKNSRICIFCFHSKIRILFFFWLKILTLPCIIPYIRTMWWYKNIPVACPSWYSNLSQRHKNGIKDTIGNATQISNDLIEDLIDFCGATRSDIEDLLKWWFRGVPLCWFVFVKIYIRY